MILWYLQNKSMNLRLIYERNKSPKQGRRSFTRHDGENSAFKVETTQIEVILNTGSITSS